MRLAKTVSILRWNFSVKNTISTVEKDRIMAKITDHKIHRYYRVDKIIPKSRQIRFVSEENYRIKACASRRIYVDGHIKFTNKTALGTSIYSTVIPVVAAHYISKRIPPWLATGAHRVYRLNFIPASCSLVGWIWKCCCTECKQDPSLSRSPFWRSSQVLRQGEVLLIPYSSNSTFWCKRCSLRRNRHVF